jgi:hypothetical protein
MTNLETFSGVAYSFGQVFSRELRYANICYIRGKIFKNEDKKIPDTYCGCPAALQLRFPYTESR